MLKALMLRKKLNDVQKQLEDARAKATAFATREAELEQAISEASTEEEQQTVEAAVEEFEAEKTENTNEINSLSERVEALEKELAETEGKQNTPPATERSRKELPAMENLAITTTRAKKLFGGMTVEQRTAMFEREDVKAFMAEIRAAIAEKRAISNIGITIPDVYLGLIRENIEGYSKLYKHVFVRNVKGEGRVTILGTIPEAVWTEMCANLNELDLGFYETEVDGYKVGGFIPVCNANLEDSDVDLAAEIISAIGQAIGLALDKALLYGKGKAYKMPLGVVTRLAQQLQPADYSANDRPWVDLHTSNIKTISNDLTGIDFYKAFVLASAAAKSKYSRGAKVWCMNEGTYTKLQAEMLSINASGAVVSGIGGTLPIVGGTVETLNFIPDNVIIGGYFDNELLVERAGTRISQSEHYRFIADQTIFKGTARYDGKPVIAEAFVAIGIKGTTVSADAVTFAEDTANPNAAGKLANLEISGVTLSATFAPDTTTYTGTTTTATGTISATPQDGFDAISITYNDNSYVPNGGSVKWAAGAGNVVKVSVKDSDTGTVTSYTVTVTKS